ncbi:MAG TPA: terminase large subunit [Clostridiales bacterium]|jgi:phage terminase large subunit-like protein|nr:terminase large subunit [Clostridiales bacterium]
MSHNYIQEYFEKINSGEIIAGKWIKLVYKKLNDELHHPINPWVFDIKKANAPIDFVETFCRNSKGRWMGKPVRLLLWQKALLQAVYGFADAKTGHRRAREVFVITGRKNGKSTFLAGLGVYGMLSEKGAQVLCSANKYQQARIIFDEARNMVLQSPELSQIIRKRKTDLYCDENFSSMIPLSKNSRLADGLNCSLALVDEVHENTDRYSYDVIKQSQSAREQPLIFTISTAGFARQGLFDILHKYGTDILEGRLTDKDIPYGSFLPFFYELDDPIEIDKSNCWMKANPSLGQIKSFDELKANADRAKVDATFLPTLKAKDFDIPENVENAWLTPQELTNTATFDPMDFKGSYFVGGVDLSETTDLTCATALMMRENDKTKYVLQHYFIPGENAEKKIRQDKVPYDVYQKQGLITCCEGNRVDYNDVTKWFTDVLMKKYGIYPIMIGADRWNTQYWFRDMKEKGLPVEGVGQGYKSMSPTMKALKVDFADHLINYNNNQLTKWNLSNCAIKPDPAGNIKFDKSKNRNLRIDGVASLCDAYFILMEHYGEYQSYIKGK